MESAKLFSRRIQPIYCTSSRWYVYRVALMTVISLFSVEVDNLVMTSNSDEEAVRIRRSMVWFIIC